MPAEPRLVLAGDVGGTNARLALFEARPEGPSLRLLETLSSRAHATFDEILRAFRARHPEPVEAACVGIAGPVVDGRVAASNLPWTVDGRVLAGVLGLPRAELINDLEANAYGLAALGPDDVATLREGEADAAAGGALISAGTGLGEAGLRREADGSFRPIRSEGGHADFAPNGELQVELLGFLAREFGHVSWERVLSGPGLLNVYRFLRDSGRGTEPGWLAEELRDGDDAPAAIARAAETGRSELCAAALELFAALYGAEAGNLALKFLALGGVFLGGGIAPKILPILRGPGFLAAFADKGRLRPLLEKIPVRVILADRTALLGAARRAAAAAGTR
jgi:glucokinase